MDGPNTRSWRRARLAAPPLAAEHLLASPTAPERPAPKPASFAWLVSSSALSISLSTFGCGRLDMPSGPAEVAVSDSGFETALAFPLEGVPRPDACKGKLTPL